jgi:hypothetical protein
MGVSVRSAVQSAGLLLAAALAASCAGQPKPGEIERTMLLDHPPDCVFTPAPSGRGCFFMTSDGRERRIRIDAKGVPFEENFANPEAERARLAEDPRAFWESAALAMEARSGSLRPADVRIRHQSARVRDHRLDPDGAQACVDYVFDYALVPPPGGEPAEVDNVGVHCVHYNPATDNIGEVIVEYMELRPDGVPPDPDFAADAARVTRSLETPRVR